MTTKGVTITVAAIGAVATLGAALFSNLNKSKEPSASIQQTASGAGAVNVGGNAVFNNIKSPAEEAAERVQACEAQHGMKTASDKTDSLQTIPASDAGPQSFVGHTSFRSCTWPHSRYADADGYLEIKVQSVAGPGDNEASGTNSADRIAAPCQQLTVAYQFGAQGTYENTAPITITSDSVVTVDGKPWQQADNPLAFYPDSGEFVVLHNDHYVIQTASCA